jgi:hypothetical protein
MQLAASWERCYLELSFSLGEYRLACGCHRF